MDKTEAFKNAIKNLKDDAGVDYMSDPQNWCVVHATKYMPKQSDNGVMYIPSTAMATNFEKPRTTVHTTFNHVVKPHGNGSWDDMPIVILSPYNDVVKENGNPAQIATTDTFWSVDPTRGLVLSKNAYIIKPSNDVLFNIGEHGATYKRDNYTDVEIKTILEMTDPDGRKIYEKYQNGDLNAYEIEEEFRWDKRAKKMYESAKDKHAFLRGWFEETRFNMLSHFLRDIVTRMAMEKMGFRELTDASDGSEKNVSVEKTAISMGISASAGNKGHANSFYAEMEDFWSGIVIHFNGGIWDEYGMLNAPDLQHVFNYIVSHDDVMIVKAVIQSVVNNKPLDFNSLYETYFISQCPQRMTSYCNMEIENLNQQISDLSTYPISNQEKEQRESELLQRQNELQKYINKMSKIKKMSDYDQNLAYVFQKNAEHLSGQYESWRANLSKQSGYDEFIANLKNQYNARKVNVGTMFKERD